jgi:hypothetical protein
MSLTWLASYQPTCVMTQINHKSACDCVSESTDQKAKSAHRLRPRMMRTEKKSSDFAFLHFSTGAGREFRFVMESEAMARDVEGLDKPESICKLRKRFSRISVCGQDTEK